LRIGVNALYLIPGGVGGTEIYLQSLLAAMLEADPATDFLVFTNRETPAGLLDSMLPNLHPVPQNVRASSRPARIAWEQTVLPAEAARLRLDVLFNPGFTAPAVCPCPQVTVFHDLQHKRHPEYFRWFDLPFWRALLFLSAHRSRFLVAVSEATRTDLLRFYSLAPAKIRVIPHGVDPAFFALRLKPSQPPYILAVSTLHPHKNLDTLLHAFAAFAQRHPEYRLVIAGLRGFHTAPLEALRDSLGLASRVTFTGWIPREELYSLFAGARAFVYPSRFEGFGMPILEAMAAGLPTACASVEPMAGIAGTAALLFDPADIHALERSLQLLTQDSATRERLHSAGPLRAAKFTWQSAAQSTLAVLRQAAGL